MVLTWLAFVVAAVIGLWFVRRRAVATRERERRFAESARTEAFRMREEQNETDERERAALLKRIQDAHDVPISKLKKKKHK